MQTHALRPRFLVVAADDQHRVDAQLFRVGNLRLGRRIAEIGIHAHLVGRKPEWEVAHVLLDQETDEPPQVRRQCAMDTRQCFAFHFISTVVILQR